jgi:molybdenum cofactor biosynthesis enzyme MoaA
MDPSVHRAAQSPLPAPDPTYVRASVSAHCNLDCVYCPKEDGMENRVPDHLKGASLSVAAYCDNLRHIARSGIRGVSFTGGEPTLNPALPQLAAYAATVFERVELTTNGFKLREQLPSLAPHLTLLKVSLDAVAPGLVESITQGRAGEADRAVAAIRAGCAAGLRVGVNTVVLRSNAHQIEGLIDLCRRINAEGHRASCYVSLLDFYFTPSRRSVWEAEFFPLEQLAEQFAKRWGPPEVQERFGCRFFWFDVEGTRVRFKDSLSATQRAAKCVNCKHFCQEGIYGIKHSVEGWVTSCPTNDAALGTHLEAGLTDAEADQRLLPLTEQIRTSRSDPESFSRMISTHGLVAPLARPAAPAREGSGAGRALPIMST